MHSYFPSSALSCVKWMRSALPAEAGSLESQNGVGQVKKKEEHQNSVPVLQNTKKYRENIICYYRKTLWLMLRKSK